MSAIIFLLTFGSLLPRITPMSVANGKQLIELWRRQETNKNTLSDYKQSLHIFQDCEDTDKTGCLVLIQDNYPKAIALTQLLNEKTLQVHVLHGEMGYTDTFVRLLMRNRNINISFSKNVNYRWRLAALYYGEQ